MTKAAVKIGNGLVSLVTGLLAVALLLYGGLMLRDMFLTEVKAFSSYNLMQYRPKVEEAEPPYLDELLAINPDTTGWLTIYNTHIDYPVMQGKTDMDYINKDVYGSYTASGSIFMSSENAGDYSEPYTLLYGHHMSNGAMFGDIPKFKDKTVFDGSTGGILIRDGAAYDLTVMALLETDAYDEQVYRVQKEDITPFMDYLKEKATYFKDVPYERILAMSTCNDASTAGRTVLICAMNERSVPLPPRTEEVPVEKRQAVGHETKERYWGLLTLVTMLALLLFALRILWMFRKEKANWWRIALAVLLAAAGCLGFFLTENLKDSLQMTDQWTPCFLGALLLMRLLLIGSRIHGNNDCEGSDLNAEV